MSKKTPAPARKKPSPVTYALVSIIAVLVVVGTVGVIVETRGGDDKDARLDAAAKTWDAPKDGPRTTSWLPKTHGVKIEASDVDEAAAATEGGVPVVIYEDFQCPACQAFNGVFGERLDELVADGTVALEIRPIAFLDGASTTRYSTRAFNAAMCALDASTGAREFWATTKALWVDQPAEGGQGLSDRDLADLVRDASGLNVDGCVGAGGFNDLAEAATAAAEDEIQGTPTVLVAGEKVVAEGSDSMEDWANRVDAAIAAAAA